MNTFQQRCGESIRRVLARHDLVVDFVEHPAGQSEEDGAALFLRGDVVHVDRHYRLYVYPDGAGANVGRNWYVLESQGHASPDALIETFCGFLQLCLEGNHPVKALEEARR